MNYGSPFHIASILLPLTIITLLFLFLRRKSEKLQRIVVFSIMILNVLQHLLKPFIYPWFYGSGFSSQISAYNMCAVLILSSPIVFLWGSRFFKNFVFFVGTVAGIGAISIPFWYMGRTIPELGWDYLRFYLCHALLFFSSLLPLLLGLHKPSYKEFWQVGLGFLLALAVVILNDVIFISLGLFSGIDGSDIYAGLKQLNPCWVMGPPPELPWLAGLADILSPKVFLGQNPTGNFAPLLWYALPVYAAISILAFGLFALLDRKQFQQDLNAFNR